MYVRNFDGWLRELNYHVKVMAVKGFSNSIY